MACKVFFLAVVVLSLIGTALGQEGYCEDEECALSESELESVIRKAYRKGYQAGYDSGLSAGFVAGQQLSGFSTQIPEGRTDIPRKPSAQFDPDTNTWEFHGTWEFRGDPNVLPPVLPER